MTWHVAIKQSKLKPGKKKMITVAKKLVLIGQTDDTYLAKTVLIAPPTPPHLEPVVANVLSA